MRVRAFTQGACRSGGIAIAIILVTVGCRPNLTQSGDKQTGGYSIFGDNDLVQATQAKSFHIELSPEGLHGVDQPNSNHCAGDARIFKFPGSGEEFAEDPFSASGGTVKPAFIKNVSVDITDSNYEHASNQAGACGYPGGDPAPSRCATFDNDSELFPNFKSWTEWGSGTPPSFFKYYTLFDDYCVTDVVDPEFPGMFVGGVSIDLDRKQMGANENVLLHVRFYPFGPRNIKPNILMDDYAGTERFGPSETAHLKVHLMSISEGEGQIQAQFQPRYVTYSDEARYPKVVRNFTVLSPVSGFAIEKQLLIPLAAHGSVDRIRIERESGSAMLMGVTVYRLGGGV